MDPRIARTRSSLREALFALTRERGLDEISVSDIAERAGVNRTTYYQHYSDKDTLLVEALDVVLADTVGDLDELDEGTGQQVLLDYVRHVEEHADLYRTLLGDHGSATVQLRVQQRVQAILEAAFEREDAPHVPGLPPRVGAAALAGSGLGIIRAWLETEPLPSHEVAAGWVWTMLHSHSVVPAVTSGLQD